MSMEKMNHLPTSGVFFPLHLFLAELRGALRYNSNDPWPQIKRPLKKSYVKAMM